MAIEPLRVEMSSKDFDTTHFEVQRLEGTEAIGRPYRFELVAVTHGEGAPGIDDLIGASISITFRREDEVLRHLHGFVLEAETFHDTEDAHASYRLVLGPRLMRSSLVHTVDIFMDLSVVQIIEKKLALVDLGAHGVDYDTRLVDAYPVREFVVQYHETDLDFVSRLVEHVGISYFFEHGADAEKLVLTDNAAGFHALPGDANVEYRRRGEHIAVHALQTRRRLIPATYVCRDYNYRTPLIELMGVHRLEEGDMGGLIEYGGHFKTTDEAERLARVRGEELMCRRTVHAGRSDDVRFFPGAVFHLTGHPDVSGALLLSEVHHRFEQTAGMGLATGGARSYENRFEATRADLVFRPERRTPIPRVAGMLTGVVEADETNPVGSVPRIDEEGRYRVRFMFDTAAPGERQASRPVRRLQASAGPNYGMHFPLRPGIEVQLAFVNGDPDRPIIVGAAPNPLTPSPVDASTATKNRIRTQSGVLFEIEDGS